MYSKQEASQVRQRFWTGFGQYMAPVPSAEGTRINWINYKTAVKGIRIRMDVDKKAAYIGMEIFSKDPELRQAYYNCFLSLKPAFERIAGDDWIWDAVSVIQEQPVSRIFIQLENVNIFNENTWPGIISFFKSRLIALDNFWVENKEIFEMYS